MDETTLNKPIVDKPISVDDLATFLSKHRWVDVEHPLAELCGLRMFDRFENGKLCFRSEDNNASHVPFPGAGCEISKFLRYGFCDEGFEVVMAIPGKPNYRIFYRYAMEPG